jgi:hypothetical protein
MKAVCSADMSADFYRITWRYITEGTTLHDHCCEVSAPIFILLVQICNYICSLLYVCRLSPTNKVEVDFATVSRPFRLGVGYCFDAHEQILIFLCLAIIFFVLHLGRPL